MAFNEPPPKPRGLLWKKNRKWAEDFYRWMSENQPQYGGPLRKFSNGFGVVNPPRRTVDIPHFSPQVSGTTSKELGITWGWFHAPNIITSANEIPQQHLYPWMPTIGTSPGTGLVALDAATPNKLALNNNNTTLITLKVGVVTRSTIMGETELLQANETPGAGSAGIGSTGLTVWSVIDQHRHGIETADPGGGHSHSHDDSSADPATGSTNYGTATLRSQLDLLQLSYHVTTAPEFIATAGTTWPVDTESTHNIPWGKFVLDSDGGEVSREWYWTGDRDYFPPNYIRSSVSEGHIIAGDASSTLANDASINPS